MKQVTFPLGSEEFVFPISSTLGKEYGKYKFDGRSIKQVAGPLGSEEYLRIDTHLQQTSKKVEGILGSEESLRIYIRLKQTSSMSLFPKMGNNALAGALNGVFIILWLHPI